MNFLKRHWTIILIILLPFAIYSNWRVSEYNLDDELVVDNQYIGSGLEVIPDIFTGSYFGDGEIAFGYRPVVILSFFLESYFFGIDPATSHLINIILYIILCLILYQYLKLLLPQTQVSVIIGAIFIFLVHPLHVEVVASAKNREEILAFLFLGLTAIGSLKYVEKRNLLWIVAILLLSVLAVFSKKSALPGLLMLPAAVIMFHPYRLRELVIMILAVFLVVTLTSPLSLTALFAIMGGSLLLYFLLYGLQKDEPVTFLKDQAIRIPRLLVLHVLAVILAFYLPLWGMLISFLLAGAYFLATKHKLAAGAFLVALLAAFALVLGSKHLLLLSIFLIGQLVCSNKGHKAELWYSYAVLLSSTAALLFLLIQDLRLDFFILIGYVGASIFLVQKSPAKRSIFLLYSAFSLALLGYLVINSQSILLVFAVLAIFISIIQAQRSISLKYNALLPLLFVAIVAIANPLALQLPILEAAPLQVSPNDLASAPNSIIRDIGRDLHPTESIFVNDISIETKLATSIFILGEYLKLHIWPHPLRFFYGYAFITEKGFNEFLVWLYLLLYASLGSIALWQIKRRPVFSFGVIFYLICLLPFSNLLIPVAGMMGERLSFVASFGFCIALSSAIGALEQYKLKRPAIAGLGLLCIIYGVLSYNRAALWKDKRILYLHDIAYTEESAKMNQLVGSLYYDLSRTTNNKSHFEKAIFYLDRAKKIYPDYEVYWTVSAMAFQQFGYYQDAFQNFQKAIEINPTDTDSYFNIAVCAEQIGDVQSAAMYYERYLDFEPNNTNVYANLSFLYFRTGQAEKAIDVSKRAIRQFPNDPNHPANLGKIFLSLGDDQNAIFYFQQAADMDFTDPQLYFALASLLEERGSIDEAAFYREIGNSKRQNR